MKSFLSWLITSSADPLKVSLAFRGILVGMVPIAMSAISLACSFLAVCIDPSIVHPLIDAVVNLSKVALELVAGGMILFGILRKIYYGRIVHPDA